MNSLKKAAVKAVVNAPGKRLSKKWVIIESDDWGSIRTSSKASLERLKKKGYPVEECPFTSNDALESNKDLEVLFGALSSVKGSDGKPAKITFDTVLTNPDFNKIKTNGFQRMEVEHFYETTNRIKGSEKVQTLYQEGMSAGVMKSQFHGLHHVHSNNWLSALKKGEKRSFRCV